MFYSLSNPWQEMEHIQNEMNRMFDLLPFGERSQYPPVNIWTNSDSMIVSAELPGYAPDSVTISVLNDVLRLQGNRNAPDLSESEYFHRNELRHGTFERIVKLPFKVDENQIDAVYKEGILNITLARAPEDKPRKISVKIQ